MNFVKILSDQRDEILNFDPSVLVKRKEEGQINLHSNLAQVVIGVRRCGKSTLCKKVLVESGMQFGYVNFDDERLIDLKPSDFDSLLETLYRINGEFRHLLLDEIQNIPRWELFVNRLLRQGMKLLITGSNANLLSSDLTTHLAGRHNEIRLYPFSFSEYCEAKRVDVTGLSTRSEALRQRALDKYLFAGGFPEITEGEEPQSYASSLLHTIVYKDICARHKIRYKERIWKLANMAIDRFCQEIPSSGLAKELDIKSTHTVDNYLKYLSDAFLICPVNKFSWKSAERRSIAKSYTIDLSFVSSHEAALQGEALGWRLENVVALELLNRNDKKTDRLYYYRKSREYEVDFVVVEREKVKELVQVCYDFRNPSAKLYRREINGLLRGAEELRCANLTLVIMEGEEKVLEAGGKRIKVCRAANWLSGIFGASGESLEFIY